jgi:hypothetical protein
MKMRQENSESVQERKKQKSSEDDIDDNESIETVSDDEFDQYLGQLKFFTLLIKFLFLRSFYGGY